MKGFRSPILGALLALSCLPAVGYHRLADEVESILDNALSYVPDLPRSETMDLLLADVNAGALVGTRRAEHEARRVADDVIAWANGGRRPILLRDEQIAGEWRARIAFLGPGNYRAESYRNASTPGERGEVILREATTRADAWRVAVEEAKARALDGQVARLSAAMGRDVRPEVERLLGRPQPTAREIVERFSAWASEHPPALDLGDAVTFDLAIKAGRLWLADCDPDAAGIFVHLGTGTETVTTDPRFLAGRAAGEIEHRGARSWFFARALVLREPGVIKSINLRNAIPSFEVAQPQVIDLNPAYESGAPMATIGIDGVPLAHVIFDRSNPPTPKLKFSDISTTRPPLEPSFDLNRALRQVRHTIGIDLASEPRYSAKPKPAKPPVDPEVKAEWRSDQRIRKAGRTATKKRRGWS